MKKNLALFASALVLSLLPACGESNAASKAVGSYALDKAEFEKAMKAQMPAEAASNPMAAQMIAQMLEKMDASFELRADGTASFTMPDKQEDGTWKLEGEKITLTMASEPDAKVATFKDNAITIEHEEEGQKMQMVFRRK